MTCKAYTSIFQQYMEGILEQAAQEDLQQHIKTCPACNSAHREFSRMRTVLVDSLNPPSTGRQMVSQAITSLEIKAPKTSTTHRTLAPFLKYGAAAAVFLTMGLYIGSRQFPNLVPQQKPLSMTVSELQGDVLVRHNWESAWKKMTPEEALYKGDKFLSLHQASLVLSLDPNNTVSLNENSSLDLLEHNGRTEFEITYGTVKAKLDGPHEPFFISTPQGRFEALGTEFIVRVR